MKNGRAEAKDFPDARVLAAIRDLRKPYIQSDGTRWVYEGREMWEWVTRWDIQKALGIPFAVLCSKLASLSRKGFLTGCTSKCNCRGDIALTELGEAKLQEAT